MSASFVLTASVLYRTEDGKRKRYKRGDTISVADDQVDRLKAAGAIAAKSSDDGKLAVETPGDEPTPSPEVPDPGPDQVTPIVAETNTATLTAKRPVNAAHIDVWKAYVRIVRADLTDEQIDRMTKDELKAAAPKEG